MKSNEPTEDASPENDWETRCETLEKEIRKDFPRVPFEDINPVAANRDDGKPTSPAPNITGLTLVCDENGAGKSSLIVDHISEFSVTEEEIIEAEASFENLGRRLNKIAYELDLSVSSERSHPMAMELEVEG